MEKEGLERELEEINKKLEEKKDKELLYRKGLILERLARFKEAYEAFDEAVKLDPSFKLANDHKISLERMLYKKTKEEHIEGKKEIKDPIISFYKKHNKYFRFAFYALLLIALVITLYIRLANIPGLTGGGDLFHNNYLGQGGSLTGLDPYFFYEAFIHILNQGLPPIINHLQYPPLGYPMRYTDILVSYFGAFLYRSFSFMTGGTPIDWFILIPPIMAAIIAAIIFFIVFEITKNYPASILASLIFSAFQTNLSRASAGFTQKTEIGYVFIFLVILLMIKMYASKKPKLKILFSILAWIAIGIDFLTTGYVQYLFIIIPVFYILLILFGLEDKYDLYAFAISFIWILIPIIGFASLGSVDGNPAFTSVFEKSALGYWATWFEVLVLLAYDKFVGKISIFKGKDHKYVMLMVTLLIAIAIFIVPKFSSIKNLIVSELLHPLGVGKINPVTLTIAEYGSITLNERYQDFGFSLLSGSNTIGINLLLFYGGVLLALYYLTKRFKHGKILYALAVPLVFLMNQGTFSYGLGEGVLIGEFALATAIPTIIGERKINLLNFILFAVSLMLLLIFSFLISNANPVIVHYYVYAALGLIALLLIFSYLDEEQNLTKESAIYLFLGTFFIATLVLSNTEVRLLQPMEIIAAPLIAFLVYKGSKYLFDLLYTSSNLISWVAIAVIAAFMLLDVYTTISTAMLIVEGNGSGLSFWGPALVWLRNNTPVNTSVVSWWDYGYWIQAIGNRTSVADGSNAYGYQSMIAKYLFTAESPYIYSTYLNFMHKPGYFVISGSEIGKYTAITTIASNADRPVYIGIAPLYTVTYSGYPQSYISMPGVNTSQYPYEIILQAYTPLQANYYYKGVDLSNQPLLYILFPWNGSAKEGMPMGLGKPYGFIYDNLVNQYYVLPMEYECIYGKGCITVNSSGIPGGVELLNASPYQVVHIATPQFNYPDGIQTVALNLSQYGDTFGALFIPNDTINTLFTRLYLLGENIPGFKLVYSNGIPVNSLISAENEVITNVNIYQINYTELSKYNLTTECSPNPSSINYCDNLSFLPNLFASKLQNASSLYGV